MRLAMMLVQEQVIHDPRPGETYEVIATPDGNAADPLIGQIVFFVGSHPVTDEYRLRLPISGTVVTGHYTLAPYQ
jgi:hypothetical protein